MAQFSIKPDNAKLAADDEFKWIRELDTIGSDIRTVRNQLGFNVATKANIRNRLSAAVDSVADCECDMSNMYSALNEVISTYTRSEDKILGKLPEVDWADAVWDVVGKIGIVGSVITAIKDLATSTEMPAAKWASLANDAWDIGWDVGDLVKECKKNPDVKWWKAIIGADSNSFLKSISKSNLGWQERALHGWDKGIKGTLREFKTASGAVKQVGGLLLSGVVNGFDNFQEFGSMESGRFWAETVTETAVDWGKDILIGAGVTAAFAAAGVAAPVVAVGAATVAVSVAADWICEAVTGKDLTEFVSDGIIDLVGNGVKRVKEEASALWRNVKNGWNKWTGGKARLQFA